MFEDTQHSGPINMADKVVAGCIVGKHATLDGKCNKACLDTVGSYDGRSFINQVIYLW